MASDAPTNSPAAIPDFAALKRELSRSRKPELLDYRAKMRRLLILFEDAQTTNVRAACKRNGCSAPTYYKRWRKFLENGFDLAALLLAAQNEYHPLYTTTAMDERICELGEEYPDMSPDAIARQLALEGMARSGVTVRHTLVAYGLGRNLRPRRPKSDDQSPVWIPKDAPLLLEPSVRQELTPGEKLGVKLVQSVFFVRTSTPLGIVYVHTIVDPTSGHVWSAISPRKDVRDAVLLLQSTCDFYRGLGQSIEQVTTSERREFRGPAKIAPSSGEGFRVPADARRVQEEARVYWAMERQVAGIDERGHLSPSANQLATSSTLRHRVYLEFLKARDIKHNCPDHGGRVGYTAEFDPTFKTFADTARNHFFAPWRKHQKLLQSQGKPFDDFETLVLRFNQWVALYNDFVHQPPPLVEKAPSNQSMTLMEYIQSGSQIQSVEPPATRRPPR